MPAESPQLFGSLDSGSKKRSKLELSKSCCSHTQLLIHCQEHPWLCLEHASQTLSRHLLDISFVPFPSRACLWSVGCFSNLVCTQLQGDTCMCWLARFGYLPTLDIYRRCCQHLAWLVHDVYPFCSSGAEEPALLIYPFLDSLLPDFHKALA
jgi:hypothetical protein